MRPVACCCERRCAPTRFPFVAATDLRPVARCCERRARAPVPAHRRRCSLVEPVATYCYSYYARVVAPPPSPPAAAPPPTARCSRSRAVAVLVLQRRHTAVCMHTATATCDLWRACTLRRFAYRIADGRRWLGRWLLYCYTTQCHALVPVSHAQQVGGSRAVRRDAYRCELPLKRTN